jgi:hypothetical protein
MCVHVSALIYPCLSSTQEALVHKELLIAAAAAGDFEEWTAEPRGVKLDIALNKRGTQLSHEFGSESDETAYRVILPEVAGLLESLDTRQDLWGGMWEEVEPVKYL